MSIKKKFFINQHFLITNLRTNNLQIFSHFIILSYKNFVFIAIKLFYKI